MEKPMIENQVIQYNERERIEDYNLLSHTELDNNFYDPNLNLWLTMKTRLPAFLTNAEFASTLTKKYIETIDLAKKKKDGQVFTPLEIANYMASMIALPRCDFSLIDPGAGTGILLAAVCDRIIAEAKKPLTVQVTAYETDEKILSCLESCLEHCISSLHENGHTLVPIVVNSDFIKDNIHCLDNSQEGNTHNLHSYDVIISNPPYQKLPRLSQLRGLLPEIIFGRTNLYGIFIALGITLLNDSGQFVFFTPRSYCSGQYHKKIRELLLNNSCIKTIHSFESRHNIFEEHDVLQEVIILHGVKTQEKKCSPINVRSTLSQTLDHIQSFTVPYSYIIPRKNPIQNIHIPQTKNDLKIIDIVQSWENSLADLGYKISTGKVVDFRAKQNLRESSDDISTVPLLWMQHVKNGQIAWPLPNFKKPQYIISSDSTKAKLVPVQNYVLLRRFSSKEEKKRIQAFPFIASQFSDYPVVGFENHLNYLYRIDDVLSLEETYGFSAFLNSPIIDRYYRMLSGNTQVNSSDIMNLPLPKLDTIIEIGMCFTEDHYDPIRSNKKIEKILRKS
jgi:adenine-specific DNA-methyltransferase